MHSVTLSSEQAAILMPVLQQLSAPTAPTIQLGSNEATVSGSATGADGPSFTIQELFEKKKKNTKSTLAQNFLLVSCIATCIYHDSNCGCIHVMCSKGG